MEDMPTLHDVADLAGVSIATVSNVINNSKHVTAETRERVEQAIAQTGYVPNQAARLLARQRKSVKGKRTSQSSNNG
jgi:LacI family transcriptional regulator